MVRKIANGFLIFILLLTTTGVIYHYHYCGNTLMSFSVLRTPKPCCEHPENCCHDKATTYQLRVDYDVSVDQPDFSVSQTDLPAVICHIYDIQVAAIDPEEFPEALPPPTVSMRLAKLQQFLF